ncbi:hypothetical protein BDV93DRAFT_365198 [Ceratobasidium sp. AG-I]|nr:hypothetical protein BDV93DRAFT_365198 [Ceratobasidium sp. AG-I]
MGLSNDQSGRDVVVVVILLGSYWTPTNKHLLKSGSYHTIRLHWNESLLWITTPQSSHTDTLGGPIAVQPLDPSRLPTTRNPLTPNSEILGSKVKGLALENAFTSVPDVVRTLYSSKWLLYCYLGPLGHDK